MKLNLNIDTSIPVEFQVIEDIADARFIKGKVWICHVGQNLNNSIFTKDVISRAIPSLSNIPVLGFIQAGVDNEADFAGHEQRIVIDNDGARFEYLGRAYGVVPETNNAKFESKMCSDGIEREFLTAEVLIYTKFQEAVDIVTRDGVHSQSMELYPDSIQGQFNKEGIFEFTNFKFEGLCLLGEDVNPAMTNSVLELFSQFSYTKQMNEMLKEFNENFSQITEKEKGGTVVDAKLKIFEKYPTLSEEDVASIKAHLEIYTEEQLEEKLSALFQEKLAEEVKGTEEQDIVVEEQQHDHDQNQEEEVSTPVEKDEEIAAPEKEKETHFTATEPMFAEAVAENFSDGLYIYHDENRVYVTEGEVSSAYSYSVVEEKIVIEYENPTAIKFVAVDLEEGETGQALVRSDQVKESMQEISDKFESLTQALSSKEQELFAKSQELENMVAKFEELNSKYTAKIEEENKALAEAMFAQFSKELTEEEMASAKSMFPNHSLETIENALYALVGKKKAKFSQNTQTSNKLIELGNQNDDEEQNGNGKSYDELFKRFGFKK